MSIFQKKIIKFIYKELINDLNERNLLTEFDLQVEISNIINDFEKKLVNKTSSTISIFSFSCVYFKLNDNRYIYPDLLILYNHEISIIIELKFFRRDRIFNSDEIINDLVKIKKIIKKLKEPIVGLEIIIDFEKHHEKIKHIADSYGFSIFNNYLKENSQFLYIIYIPNYHGGLRNRTIHSIIQRIQKKLI